MISAGRLWQREAWVFSSGRQFWTSAHDAPLGSLELVSEPTEDRTRVRCPAPALPQLHSSAPSSCSILHCSCTHSLLPAVRRPRGCSEAGSARLLAGSARRTRDDGRNMDGGRNVDGVFRAPGPGWALTWHVSLLSDPLNHPCIETRLPSFRGSGDKLSAEEGASWDPAPSLASGRAPGKRPNLQAAWRKIQNCAQLALQGATWGPRFGLKNKPVKAEQYLQGPEFLHFPPNYSFPPDAWCSCRHVFFFHTS